MTAVRNFPIERRGTIAGISLISLAADVLAVALGATTLFTIHFVGDPPIAEIIVLFLVGPIFIAYRKRAFKVGVSKIYALMGFWLIGQILTDIYRQTAQIDWLRGDAAIGFFFMDLVFFTMLLRGNERRKILFISGLAVGALVYARIVIDPVIDSHSWKLGYSVGMNLLAVLISCLFFKRRYYIVALGIFAGMAMINLMFNYRSAALILILTAVLSVPVIPEQIGPWRVLPPHGSKRRLIVLVVLTLGAGLTALSAVDFLTSRGYLGEDAESKNQTQSQVKGGLLVGGRPEILVSSRAVMDSPILGHGSWAKDPHYMEMLDDALAESGLRNDPDVDEQFGSGLIPSHSHLMGAWVWAGILGALFWAVVFWLVIRAIVQVATRPSYLAPVYMYLLVLFAWDILFSPFGTWRRLTEGALLVIILDLLKTVPHRSYLPQNLRATTWRRGAFSSYR